MIFMIDLYIFLIVCMSDKQQEIEAKSYKCYIANQFCDLGE
jgi:hypothetical protein